MATDLLRPNPYQPRRAADPVQLAALTESIARQGVLQPILVRQINSEPPDYQIVAGERRWRAAQAAGLTEVPCLVEQFCDSDLALVALVENLQREDLSVLDEAEGYRRVIEQFGLNQQDLATAVGRSRSHVANTLRLLGLPDSVKTHLREGRLTAGHARALLTHAEPERAANAIIGGDLTVRQAEALVLPPAGSAEALPVSHLEDPHLSALENRLSASLGLRVVVADKGGHGRVTLHYRSLDQLDGIVALLEQSHDQSAAMPVETLKKSQSRGGGAGSDSGVKPVVGST